MSLQLLAIALGATLISVGEASKSCGLKEVYKSCGPRVEPTCDNWEQPLPVLPNYGMTCKRGCFCVDDYVRDDNGNCIPVSSCPIECPDNSEFSLGGGTQITCKRPRPVSSTNPGCYCNPGFVLETESNTCIPWEECPCRGQHQVYSDCVPQFPKTCNHRSNNSNHTICLSDWKGCICKPDSVLDDANVCIPAVECPPTICEVNCANKGNEIYVADVNEIRCDMTIIPTTCKKSCQCIDGYARDQSGSCIPLAQCPCPANATFALGVSVCPPTCGSLTGIRCMAMKLAGCECNEGFVKNSIGQCVLKEDCTTSIHNCPVNQEYTKNSTEYFCYRKPTIVTNACVCSNGLWYDDYSKTCVDPLECTCPKTMVYMKSGRLDYCGLGKEVLQNQCGCPGGMSFDITSGTCVLTSKCPKCDLPTCPVGQSYFALNYQQYCNQPAKLLFNTCGCPQGQWYDEYTATCVNPGKCSCPCTMVYSESGVMNYCGLGKEVIKNKCSCPDDMSYDITTGKCVLTTKCPSCKLPTCPAGQSHFAITYQQYCNQPAKLIYNTCGCPLGQWFDEFTGMCVSPGNCSCPSTMVYAESGFMDYCELGKEVIKNKCSCPDGMSFDITLGKCVRKSECSICNLPTCPAGESYFAMTYQQYCNQPAKLLYNTCGCPLGQWYDEYAGICVRPGNCSCPNSMVYSKSGLLNYCGLGKEVIQNKCSCLDGLSFDTTSGTCVQTTDCPTCNLPTCPKGQSHFAITYQYYCNQPSALLFNTCGCPQGQWYDEYTSTCVSPGKCSCPKTMVYIKSGITSYCGLGTEVVTNHCGCPSGKSYDITSSKCIPTKKCPVTEPPCCPTDQEYFAITYQLYCNQPAKFLINSCGCTDGYWYNEYSKTCVVPGNCSCPGNMVYSKDGILDYCGLGKEKIKNKCSCLEGMSFDISSGVCLPTEDCSKCNLPSCPAGQSYFAITYQMYCHQPAEFIINSCGCPLGQWYDEYTKSCVAPGNCSCPPTMAYYQTGILDYCGLGKELIKNKCGCPKGMSFDITLGKCVLSKDCKYCELPACSHGQGFFAMSYQPYCNKPGEFVYNDCACPTVQWYDQATNTCVDPGMCPADTPSKHCPNTMILAKKGRLYYCGNRNSEYRRNDCVCPPGYRYDMITSVCVLPEDCSYSNQELNCHKQDPNKEYHVCKSTSCMPTCMNQYPKYCTKTCYSGCFCKAGMMQVSYTNTTCVLPCQCPQPRCGPNSSLTDKCTPSIRCDNMYLKFEQALCDGVSRCVCDPGYVLNSKQECVLKTECTPEEINCPENMEYSTCHGCERHCNNLNPMCTKECKIGCFCKTNYVMNSDNVCVLKKDCPSVCPENEEYKQCMTLNPDTCANFLINPKPVSLYKEVCIAGCDCKFGYVRNKNNNCVSPSMCLPLELNCDANMYYSDVPIHTKYCSSKLGNFVLSEGCNCNNGLVFDRVTGDCVDITMCTNSKQNKHCKSKDPNSAYSTCPLCPRTCGNRHPICNLMCSPGCECIPGYIMSHINGICVPETHCPIIDPIQCPSNRTVQECAYGQKCENIGNQKSKPTVCIPSCGCKEGYLENSNGDCVLPTDCDTDTLCEQQDPNSEFSICGTCRRTCDNPSPICDRACHIGCFCKKGYLLDKINGICIPKNKCPNSSSDSSSEDEESNNKSDDLSIMCPPNSTPTRCKNVCPSKCPSRFKELFVCPRTIVCEIGCDCNKGYVLNTAGQCVEPTDCPPITFCNNNLEYSKVPADLQTCESYYSSSEASLRTSNCICPDDMVYDSSTDMCMSPSDCPNAIQCGLNMVYRKINTCHRTCSTYFKVQNFMCPVSTVKGCDCMDGYILNSIGQCVLPKDCVIYDCPEYMEYEVSNRARTCDDLTSSSMLETQSACFCKQGYVLNESNNCIPEDNCIGECGVNMHFEDCYSFVETCNGNIYYYVCQPGCVCDKGLVRDDLGNCISKDECPSIVVEPDCPTNQTYQECPRCGRNCANYYLNIMFKCACIPSCACKEGFIPNSNKDCVAIEDCTEEEIICPDDQQYCSHKIRKTCQNPKGNGYTSGCFCEDGYVYDEDSRICVNLQECPDSQENAECQATDQNSIFLMCQPGEIQTCDGTVYSSAICQPGCYCKPGFMLNHHNQCVYKC